MGGMGHGTSGPARSAWNHEENSLVDDKNCGTDNDFDRPSGTGSSLHRYPATSCLATISLSLRDKSHCAQTASGYPWLISGAIEDRR
jgi:hypothetical protein